MSSHKVKANPLYRLKRYYGIMRALMQGKGIGSIHELKQTIIDQYRKKYKLHTLVETGTYMGAMVKAQLPFFDAVYSIELSEELYRQNKERFRNDRNVHLLQGDSGVKIAEVVEKLKQPALFWLDGHFSSGITARGELDTPIESELKTVLSVKHINHVILIDDARLFTGDNDYPTISKVEALKKQLRPDYKLSVQYDVIRIEPGS